MRVRLLLLTKWMKNHEFQWERKGSHVKMRTTASAERGPYSHYVIAKEMAEQPRARFRDITTEYDPELWGEGLQRGYNKTQKYLMPGVWTISMADVVGKIGG